MVLNYLHFNCLFLRPWCELSLQIQIRMFFIYCKVINFGRVLFCRSSEPIFKLINISRQVMIQLKLAEEVNNFIFLRYHKEIEVWKDCENSHFLARFEIQSSRVRMSCDLYILWCWQQWFHLLSIILINF